MHIHEAGLVRVEHESKLLKDCFGPPSRSWLLKSWTASEAYLGLHPVDRDQNPRADVPMQNLLLFYIPGQSDFESDLEAFVWTQSDGFAIVRTLILLTWEKCTMCIPGGQVFAIIPHLRDPASPLVNAIPKFSCGDA